MNFYTILSRSVVFYYIYTLNMNKYNNQYLVFCKKHYYDPSYDRDYYLSIYNNKLPRIITCFEHKISHMDYKLIRKSKYEYIGYSFEPVPMKIYHSGAKMWIDTSSYHAKIIFAKTRNGFILPVHLVDVY